jgi:protein-L-isoaspartate(D-aspartate) O-methyltransferase
MIDYAAARLNMVDSQLRPNRVVDLNVLQAFLETPRELFVPEQLRGIAYVDEDVPLGSGRYLMEPMVLGRVLQFALIERHETVLEVGTGSGYGAAIMSRLARHVVAMESDPAMAVRARTALAAAGARNAAVVEGPLDRGWLERAPYNVIVFGGAVARVPDAVAEQLADGGRLLAVEIGGSGLGKATLTLRARGALSRRVIFDAGTPLLPGFEPEASFVF